MQVKLDGTIMQRAHNQQEILKQTEKIDWPTTKNKVALHWILLGKERRSDKQGAYVDTWRRDERKTLYNMWNK